MERRKFIKKSSFLGAGIAVAPILSSCKDSDSTEKTENTAITDTTTKQEISFPLVIATWDVKEATSKAWEILNNNGSALDAVELGCRVEEENATGQTVGKGGLPDREGNVSLDASIMDDKGNCGSVVYLKNITRAVSVARMVMEKTPHVMLAGDGAEQFALANGFESENLLTEESKKAWEEWKVESKYKPVINLENHDTIGILAIDKNGNISGACTTSGLAYKMAGRVGDSPIIGSGLYVDNEIGAAVATGLGEEVVKTVGSFLVVELMRQGRTPQEACEEAIARIIKKTNSNYSEFQVGYIAVNKRGETGSYSIHPEFFTTKYQDGENKVSESGHYLDN